MFNALQYSQDFGTITKQGPKLRLIGRQCDQKVGVGDWNFRTGVQHLPGNIQEIKSSVHNYCHTFSLSLISCSVLAIKNDK